MYLASGVISICIIFLSFGYEKISGTKAGRKVNELSPTWYPADRSCVGTFQGRRQWSSVTSLASSVPPSVPPRWGGSILKRVPDTTFLVCLRAFYPGETNCPSSTLGLGSACAWWHTCDLPALPPHSVPFRPFSFLPTTVQTLQGAVLLGPGSGGVPLPALMNWPDFVRPAALVSILRWSAGSA